VKNRKSAPPSLAVAAQAAHPLADVLRPGQSLELLKELHILTRDGKLNQDSRRKLKQVYHLYQFIEKLLQELPPVSGRGLTLADHGAGKSYLGFILYDLFFKTLDDSHIYGIETRAELVDQSRALAARLEFARMSFLNLSVAESAHSSELPAQVDVVTALHACDTATDDAIAFGLQKKARALVLLPGRSCAPSQPEQGAFTRPDSVGRVVAPSLAYTRVGQPDHQCAALPVSGSLGLSGHGDRVGWLGTQHEK